MSQARIAPSADVSLMDDTQNPVPFEAPSLLPQSEEYLKQLMPEPEPYSLSKAEDLAFHSKPMVTAFTPGEILGPAIQMEADLPQVQTRAVAFIPAEMALGYVKRMEVDMREMNDRYRRLLSDLDKTYESLEAESQVKYREFLQRMQGDRSELLNRYKSTVETMQVEQAVYKSQMESIVKDLKDKVTKQTLEKNELLTSLTAQLASKDQDKDTSLQELRLAYEHELGALTRERNQELQLALTERDNIGEKMAALERDGRDVVELMVEVMVLKVRNEESDAALFSTKQELSALAATLQSGSDEFSRQLLSSKDDEISRLTLENKELRRELEGLKRSIAMPSDKDDPVLAALKAQLNFTNVELMTAKGQVTAYEIQIKELQEQLENRPPAVDSHVADEEVANLREQIDKMQQEHQLRIHAIDSERHSSMEVAHNKIDELEKKNQEMTRKITQLHSEIKTNNDRFAQAEKDMNSIARLRDEHSKLSQHIDELHVTIDSLHKSNAVKEKELKDSIRQRKLLHNQLEDLKGKIRVYCRARPMNAEEIRKNTTNVLTTPDEFTINCEMKNGGMKTFVFDSVFGPDSTQEDIFEETKGLVQSAVDGYNVCIFAYGQTGSGKTYTMQGVPGNPGVTLRSFRELFYVLGRLPDHYEWSVSCYMVELYLDTLIDLLVAESGRADVPGGSLTIKKDPKGMVEIPEATVIPVSSPEELLSRFETGESARHTGATKMNDTSSRSHLIFSIFVDVTNRETNQRTVGKLSLVDLAGSERVSKAESSAERLREGRAINKSLAALGDVIAALSGGESHIPYRNNKLTMLMSDSLGGTVFPT